jgi:hypothetical protein
MKPNLLHMNHPGGFAEKLTEATFWKRSKK